MEGRGVIIMNKEASLPDMVKSVQKMEQKTFNNATEASIKQFGAGLMTEKAPQGKSLRQRCIWLRTALAAATAALRNISRRRTEANEICGRTAIRRSHNAKRSRQIWSIIG